MHRAHKIRMYPTEAQTSLLWQAVGASRFTYNWGLDKWKKMWEAHKANNKIPIPSFMLLSRVWTQEKPEWVKEVAFCIPHRALKDLEYAWKSFFRGNNKIPVFKKKKLRQGSFYVANTKGELKKDTIRIPNVGWIKLAENLRFEGKIMSYTVSTYAGEWYVSVQVEMSDAEITSSDSVVGVDVGLEKHPAYASDGTKLELPLDTLKKLERKLKRAQRALSRSQKNSHNRNKRLLKKQKVQQKIDNIRQDVTHKFTSTVCKNHATVVVEDLDIQGMLKKAKYKAIRRAFNSSLMSQIQWQLSYKAKRLIKAPRFYPSSKMCSNCGAIKPQLDPSVRTYKCERCGAVLDRDYNAALNLMKLGLVKPE